MALSFAWTALIFFSSTELAARWSDRAFGCLTAKLPRPLGLNARVHNVVHILAEKSVHVVLFLALAALVAKTLPKTHRSFGVIVAIGLVIGSGSELFQAFFPHRDPTLRDVCINVASTGLGAGIMLFTARRARSPVVAAAQRHD